IGTHGRYGLTVRRRPKPYLPNTAFAEKPFWLDGRTWHLRNARQRASRSFEPVGNFDFTPRRESVGNRNRIDARRHATADDRNPGAGFDRSLRNATTLDYRLQRETAQHDFGGFGKARRFPARDQRRVFEHYRRDFG